MLTIRVLKQFEFLQAHRIAPTWRVDSKLLLGVVGAVTQPAFSAVFADELGRDVHKVPLFPKSGHVRDESPRSTDVAGFQDVRVHFTGSWPSVSDTHQVPLERTIVRHRCRPAVIIPVDQGLRSGELGRPSRPALNVTAREVLVLTGIVDI